MDKIINFWKTQPFVCGFIIGGIVVGVITFYNL